MQVAANNFYSAAREDDEKVMSFLRHQIKHVIYIVKENRTFDQILGDLSNGSNGDSSLTQFPRASRRTSTGSRASSSPSTTSWIRATAAWTAGPGACRVA